MAPVEPQYANSNAIPIIAFTGQAVGLIATLAYIAAHLRTASQRLPPSADTRGRVPKRRRDIAILSTLSLISLAVVSYFATTNRVLSYNEWAQQRKENIPNSLWSSWYGDTDTFQLGRWFQDVNVFSEYFRSITAHSRGFWWTQQHLTSLLLWSMFVGIEGRRRHLGTRLTLAFVSLSLTAGLSVAQNLFYVLMLLTPVPLSNSTQRSPLWTPHPSIYLVPLIASLVGLDMIPIYKARTHTTSLIAGAYLVLPIFFAIGAQYAPKRFGKMHNDVSVAHRAYTSVFFWFAAATFVFHAKQTFQALYDNAPESQYTQYYAVWSKLELEQRSTYDRSRTAFVRLVNAISDHPAISSIGWDVVLSGLSYSVWAFIRGLDVTEMLKCSAIPWLDLPEDETNGAKEANFKAEKESTLPPVSPIRKTRGRPRKAVDSSSELNGNDGKRSVRSRRKVEHESDSEDAYVPPSEPTEIASTRHGEGRGDETLAEETEASALALGLFVLGGLGVASAATLGAEVRAR